MSAVFFNSDVDGSTALFNAHFAAFTWDAINPWLFEFSSLGKPFQNLTFLHQLMRHISQYVSEHLRQKR